MQNKCKYAKLLYTYIHTSALLHKCKVHAGTLLQACSSYAPLFNRCLFSMHFPLKQLLILSCIRFRLLFLFIFGMQVHTKYIIWRTLCLLLNLNAHHASASQPPSHLLGFNRPMSAKKKTKKFGLPQKFSFKAFHKYRICSVCTSIFVYKCVSMGECKSMLCLC